MYICVDFCCRCPCRILSHRFSLCLCSILIPYMNQDLLGKRNFSIASIKNCFNRKGRLDSHESRID